MNTSKASSSADERRKVDLLKEMQITTKHAKKLEVYSYDQILELNEERLKSIFGAGRGILYSMNLEKIRKKFGLGKSFFTFHRPIASSSSHPSFV